MHCSIYVCSCSTPSFSSPSFSGPSFSSPAYSSQPAQCYRSNRLEMLSGSATGAVIIIRVNETVANPHEHRPASADRRSLANIFTILREPCQLKTHLFQRPYPHLIFWPFDWHHCSGPCSNVRYSGHSKNLCLLTYLLTYYLITFMSRPPTNT